jgi:hypothetical protein
VAVAVVVSVLCGAYVVHLVGRAALHAARLRLVASKSDPENVVGIGRETGAANVLLVTSRVDGDGVLRSACVQLAIRIASACPFPDIPRRLASNGLISKMSIPCIFPRISRRSRPVACSASVGTVPGCAPGGRRSASLLISIDIVVSK